MAKSKRLKDKKAGEKSSGKFHYNPVNMSGRKAGIAGENAKEDSAERDHAADKRGTRPASERKP